jgi:type VI secretion system protein ImpA
MSEWLAVKEQGEKLLRETSKDLEVAALMVSAAVRTDGLPGLVSGLELVAELVDRYWPEMFATAQAAAQNEQPPPDDEAIATDMLRLLDQWKEVLPGPIARIPITEGSDAGSYALWQYEQAVAAEKLSPEEREKRKAVTVGRISQSASQTARRDGNYFPNLCAQLEEAGKQADRVEAAFQTHLSNGLVGLGPSLTRVKERLDDIKRCLAHVAKDYLVPAGQPASGTSQNAASTPSGNAAAAGPAGEPQNRDEAFRQLSQIADFFARTEPLSLLAEQIRQVVKRGRSSPEKYYAQLIDNEDTLRQFFRLVGIQPSSEESEDTSSES